MSVFSSVLIVIGNLALLESLAVFIFPKLTTSIGRLLKDKSKVRLAAGIELAVAVILILIGINI